MMGPNNPYGPSGPPPPGISSHTPQAMPPGMRQSPRYPPAWTTNPATHGHLTPQGGPPKSRSNMTNTQLQQLSAQMKAYRLLARNVPPPEALMSIVHGRKPTQAMLAPFNKGQTGAWSGGSGSPHGSSGLSPGGGTGGQSASSPNPSPGPGMSGGSGGNINLYPPSPNLSQSQGGSPTTPQQQQGASLTRSTSATSLNSVSTSPNVTISSSGEMPLPVRQAISAAQSGSGSSTAVTTVTGQPVTTSATKPVVASANALPSSGKALVKLVKLGPPGKPVGIDPMVIAKEREHRYRKENRCSRPLLTRTCRFCILKGHQYDIYFKI